MWIEHVLTRTAPLMMQFSANALTDAKVEGYEYMCQNSSLTIVCGLSIIMDLAHILLIFVQSYLLSQDIEEGYYTVHMFSRYT